MSKQLVVEKTFSISSSEELISRYHESLHDDFVIGLLQGTEELVVAIRYVQGNWGFYGGGSAVEKGEYLKEAFTTGEEDWDDMFTLYTLKENELTFVTFSCIMDFEDPFETGTRYRLFLQEGEVFVESEALSHADAVKYVKEFSTQKLRKSCKIMK